jgi:hypothetical protein
MKCEGRRSAKGEEVQRATKCKRRQSAKGDKVQKATKCKRRQSAKGDKVAQAKYEVLDEFSGTKSERF